MSSDKTDALNEMVPLPYTEDEVKPRRRKKKKARGKERTEGVGDYNAIRVQLLEERKKAGISREELAARSGYSIETIRHWELGETIAKVPALVDWANTLGFHLSISRYLGE